MEPIEVVPVHETRSLEKENPKYSVTKSIKNKPSDCLSQEQPKITHLVNQKSSSKRKSQHFATKSRKGSNDKNGSIERNKSKSRER